MTLDRFFQEEFFEEVLSRRGVTRESEKHQYSKTLLTSTGSRVRVLNALHNWLRDFDGRRKTHLGLPEVQEPKVSDLLEMSDQELLYPSNFGKKGVAFVDAYLSLFGLKRTSITESGRLMHTLNDEQRSVLNLLK